jgi:hypothetical protein
VSDNTSGHKLVVSYWWQPPTSPVLGGTELEPELAFQAEHTRLPRVGQVNRVKAVIRSVREAEWANSELDYRPQRHFPADSPFMPYRGVWRPFWAGATAND